MCLSSILCFRACAHVCLNTAVCGSDLKRGLSPGKHKSIAPSNGLPVDIFCDLEVSQLFMSR
jgi:hypothetical protein